MKKKLYIGMSVLILILIVALLGWAIFIGQQQQQLQNETEDLGYFDSSANTPSGGGGGLFGGTLGDVIDTVTGTDNQTGSEDDPSRKPRLRQLYNLPTAGFVKKRANAIRFVDKATGHVFEKDLPDGVTTRLDQTTIPQVQEALFVDDGDGVIRRYIDEARAVITIYSDLKDDGQKSVSLPNQLLEIVPSPDGAEISFLQKTPQGSELFLSSPEGLNKNLILSSAIRGWNINWENQSLLLSQKASSNLPGSAYVISIDTGSTKKLVLQQLNGLSTLFNPDGTDVLYSYIGDRDIPLVYVKNISLNTNTALNVAGLAEKCVWHPNNETVFCALPTQFPKGEYPDIWYQGLVHFSDSLFEINPRTNTVTHIVSPETEHGVPLDMIEMTMSANGEALFFINKTDQTLWSVTFPQEKESENEEVI